MSTQPVPFRGSTREQDAVLRGEKAYLANITDQQWVAHRTYGVFVVQPCVPGQPYTLTEITMRQGKMDLGDKRTLEFPISAREIAEDLAREINSDAGDRSFLGVFMCAGSAPTPEELAQAHTRLETYYQELVRVADQEWERSHNWTVITDVQRRAARRLKINKDWSYEPRAKVECPACSEPLKPGVAVCKSCGAILDPEKASRFGLAAPSDIALGGELAARPIRPGRKDAKHSQTDKA